MMERAPNETVAAICELLPDNPRQAAAEVMTVAAVVSVSAGIADADAAKSFVDTLARVRKAGMGSAVQ